MQTAPPEVIAGLKEFDSATIFNAVVESIGGSQGGTELNEKGGVPENYTGPHSDACCQSLASPSATR